MKTDWAHFERKLAAGKTLDQAATEMGLSSDIIREKYEPSRQATSVYSLEAVGCEAIQTALHTLQDICTAGSEIQRVAAAGHLLKFATSALKAAHEKRQIGLDRQKADGMIDLFDNVGDWLLKKPGV